MPGKRKHERRLRKTVETVLDVLAARKQLRREEDQAFTAEMDRAWAHVTAEKCGFSSDFADALLDRGMSAVRVADLLRDAARPERRV